MIKSLLLIISLLFFLSFVSCKVGDGPCSNSNTVAIKNKATDIYLAIQRKRVTLNHLQQVWCLNDESTNAHKVLNRLGAQSFSSVVLYCGNSEFVMNVRDGVLENADVMIASVNGNLPNTAKWSVVYQPSSSTYSIRTTLAKDQILALSARSLEGSEGITLTAFDEADTLQQWLFQDVVSAENPFYQNMKKRNKN